MGFFLLNFNPEFHQGGHDVATPFLTSVVNLCKDSGNDWYRVYLIRKISSQHGMEFVLKLLKEDTMRWLFPEEVLQKVTFPSVTFSATSYSSKNAF